MLREQAPAPSTPTTIPSDTPPSPTSTSPITPRTEEPRHYDEKQVTGVERRRGINLKILLPIIGVVAVVGVVVAFSYYGQFSNIQREIAPEPITEPTTAEEPASQYPFAYEWGSYGNSTGQFDGPSGIAVDASGDVYVVDNGNNRVQKFNSNGTFITTWGSYGNGTDQFDLAKSRYAPSGVAVDALGNVYVADFGNDRIQKFSSDGTFITEWGSAGTGNGQFYSLKDVAVDASGNVYVADSGNDRIQKFRSGGTFSYSWGFTGNLAGHFEDPSGVAVDALGNVYVADSGNNRIQKFSSDGTYITSWGSEGNGTGQFDSPQDVAVDASGDVFVTDNGNDRVQVFSPVWF